jgi:transposase-like protein
VRTLRADLVGPDGLLAEVTRRVLETGLEVEMSEHLGYDKHAGPQRRQLPQRHAGQDGADRHRPVDIDVPRDRDGTFEPQTVRKRQRRLGGVDAMVISLCATG